MDALTDKIFNIYTMPNVVREDIDNLNAVITVTVDRKSYEPKFIEELKTGKVRTYMKSLPIPKKQEGPVKKIVANNYDEEIHKVKKDAVIFFHAPWCGHCKEFDPVFKKVAKKMLNNNENIVFGKMDATANDVPYMFPPVKGFPTIFFLSAYEKFDPIQYQGDRSYKSLKDWINR